MSQLRSYHPGQSGISLISAVIGLALASLGFFFYQQSANKNHSLVLHTQDMAIATAYASELAELFRSMNSLALGNYLLNNPTTFSYGIVPLCAHINVLDRSTGNIVNPDPLANLPPNNPLNRGTNTTAANRYYQVQIIDSKTLTVDSAACGITTPYNFLLPGNLSKRIMVTVSVSFVPRGKGPGTVERAAITTLLPLI